MTITKLFRRRSSALPGTQGVPRRFSVLKTLMGYALFLVVAIEGLLQLAGAVFGLFPETSIRYPFQSSSYRSHDFLITVPKPDLNVDHVLKNGRLIRINTNNFGMRGPSSTREKSPDVVRIVTMGGSTTYCWNTSDGDTWSDVLARRLEAHFPNQNFEVLNAGVSGYSSFSNLIYLAGRVVDLEPDFVVLYQTANDLLALQQVAFDGDYDGYTTVARVGRQRSLNYVLYKTSMLARVAYEIKGIAGSITAKGSSTESSGDPLFLGEVLRRSSYFARNVTNFVSIAENAGITVVLSTQASPYPHLEDDSLLWDEIVATGIRPFGNLRPDDIPIAFSHYSDQIRTICRSHPSVICVDNAEMVEEQIRESGMNVLVDPSGDGVFVDWIHCQETGNRMIGGNVANGISAFLEVALSNPESTEEQKRSSDSPI